MRNPIRRETDNESWFGPLHWVMVVGAVSLAAVLFSLSEVLDLSEAVSSIVRELGVAFLVAAILTLTFERLLGEQIRSVLMGAVRRLDEAELTAILRAAGTPEPTLEQLRTSVFRQACFRTRYRLSVNLQMDPGHQDWLFMSNVGSFDVTNPTLHDANYWIDVWIEKYLDPLRSNITKVEIRRGSGVEVFEGQNMGGFLEDKDVYRQFRKMITLEPDETVHVVASYTGVRHKRDYWYWVMTHSTGELELVVSHPDGIDVSAFAVHPDKDVKFEPEDTGDPLRKYWRLTAGLLPYQGVEIRWEPS